MEGSVITDGKMADPIFLRNRAYSHTKSCKSPTSGVLMQSLYMYKSSSATVNTNCKLGLPVLQGE